MITLENIHTDTLTIKNWCINSDECWAVIGRNGSGKRSLGKLLTQELQPSPFAHMALLSFEQQQAFYEQELKNDDTDFMDHIDPGTTVRELLALEGELPPELGFLDLEKILDRGYRLLSSGESRKALLAQALLQKPDFLVLDEPYDSLDVESKKALTAFFVNVLSESTTQLFFLLNSLEEISAWHTHVAVIEHGEVIAQGPREGIQNNSAIKALLSFDASLLPPWPESLSIADSPQVIVDLREGRVSYSATVIFDKLDLRINKGQHTLITGANGSGKSTLLSLITGDHPQSYGNDLRVLGYKRGSGETIWQLKQGIGIVTPDLHRNHRVPGNALQIVLSGFFDSIGLYQGPSPAQITHAQQWLCLVGLKEKADLPFKTLSYGEQRLVLIARALTKQPALLILDEPTQGLDDINRHRLMHFLKHLSSQQRTTIVMASHRLDERLPIFVQHIALS